MKEIMVLYAKYNRETNKEIIKLLSTLPDDNLYCERNMYCKSINNLFNHLVMAEWYYLCAVLSIAGMSYPNESEREEAFRRIETSFTQASQILSELDIKLVEVMNILNENDFQIERKNNRIYNGRVIDIKIWEYMSQHIIHQTHHRGQLSQVLDELKIENDFGNMFPYIKDSITQSQGDFGLWEFAYCS
jgi:uncharacterized damage-inducible protein DinB